MKSKVKLGSSKFRAAHSSKKPHKRAPHMTGEVSGYARGNRSTKKRKG